MVVNYLNKLCIMNNLYYRALIGIQNEWQLYNTWPIYILNIYIYIVENIYCKLSHIP